MGMLAYLLAVVVVAQDPSQSPRAVLRVALDALEGDSVPAAQARWTRRLTREPGGRAAAFGLATLARLTYDYPAAELHFNNLIESSPSVRTHTRFESRRPEVSSILCLRW